ncbi:MAG: hypothetical protein ACYC0H_22950 [Solirubrobacteraceae bacterium]
MSPDTTPNAEPTQGATDQPGPEHRRPGALSEHDPPTDSAARNRPPLLVVIAVVLLVTAFVVLHLTGVFGPSSH